MNIGAAHIALIAGPMKPPRSMQGLGLPYLAAVLEEAGFRPEIFDLYPPPPRDSGLVTGPEAGPEARPDSGQPDTSDPAILDGRLADHIAQRRPDIVGMTIHTPDYAARVRLACLLRERLPRSLLVAGGHHPCAEPDHLLRNSDFDVCVIGEGEETLLEIARRLANGTGVDAADRLRDIKGLVYKHEDQIVHTPPRPPVKDLDSLPFPAHHLLRLQSYTAHPTLGIKGTSIITYRGCPMRCAFCLNPQSRRVRRRSPSRVVDEMTRVVEGMGIRGFSFHDNLFGLSGRHALALCEEIIQRRPDVFWDSWTAGDLVDTRLAARMKAAGCLQVGFGAESGDDQVLIKSQRGFTAAQNQAGIAALRGSGIKVDAFFMIGLPGETEASVRRTVDFAAHCGADKVHLSVYRPYPGTAVWNDPDAFGVRITKGENFEAYLETKDLSRAAILELARQGIEELKQAGFVRVDTLRCDEYEWE